MGFGSVSHKVWVVVAQGLDVGRTGFGAVSHGVWFVVTRGLGRCHTGSGSVSHGVWVLVAQGLGGSCGLGWFDFFVSSRWHVGW